MAETKKILKEEIQLLHNIADVYFVSRVSGLSIFFKSTSTSLFTGSTFFFILKLE